MAKPDFCAVYQIRVPLVLAGMAMISEPPLVAAVSEAGGLGTLGTGPMPPSELQARIAEVRALTTQPFGVNQIVETTALGDLTTEADLAVIADQRLPFVVFFWNLPKPAWLESLRRAGTRIWQTVTSVEDARAALAAGVDALMVQGLEAGGHNRSRLGLKDLLPEIAGMVTHQHVIAAGGIADARSAATAMSLGADAVCMGTRFVASEESPAHEAWKRRIVAASAADTEVTRLFGPEWPNVPMRVLRNRAVERFGSGSPDAPRAGSIGSTVLFGSPYTMPAGSAVLPTAFTEGDIEEMCLAAGTSVGVIDQVLPAAQIVEQVAAAFA